MLIWRHDNNNNRQRKCTKIPLDGIVHLTVIIYTKLVHTLFILPYATGYFYEYTLTGYFYKYTYTGYFLYSLGLLKQEQLLRAERPRRSDTSEGL